MRLLIVEDSSRLAGLLVQQLDHIGFSSDVAATLEEAEHARRAAQFDLVVLDLGLPDGDGLEWLRTARLRGLDVPVLILTARGSITDRVAGLDAGADDYLVKPFELNELAARLRALLRRPGVRSQAILTVGPLKFDIAGRTARIGQRPLRLTRREAALLELLMREAGTVVSRGTIQEKLYSFDETFTPNAVEAIVSRLRHRLEDAGGGGLLSTIRGVGYVLGQS